MVYWFRHGAAGGGIMAQGLRSAWHTLVLVVFLAMALVPRAGAVMFSPESFTLSNGMQVVVIPNHRAPIVIHMVWYKVGAADQPAGKSGIAHFLEHLMFKGTKTVKPGEFSKIVARNGGTDNAFTTHDYTAYFQKVAKDKLELMMRLEADRMTNLVLTDAEVLPEREVVQEERRSRTDNDPAAQLYEQAQAALYLNHPYRFPIIGWGHEIAKLSTADAIAFYRRFYVPNNAILIVAGDITAAELRPLAEKYYGAIARGHEVIRTRPAEPDHRAARRVVLTSPQVGQPSWSRTYIAPSYSTAEGNQAYALQVLADVMGGGTTSRLYRRLVVEQGIAASAGAWYNSSRLDVGTFGVSASPRPGTSPAALEAAVIAELKRIVSAGVTAAEVARVKKSMTASAIYARDSLRAGPNIFGRALTTGQTIADVEAWPERIAAVTVDEVNAAARAVLKETDSVTSVLLRGKES